MTALPGGLAQLVEPLRRRLAGEVIALFNDRGKGERPVRRRLDGLFGPNSVAWRVHGDVTSMMAGGIAGLLLQMLMPEVLAGVWDHSKFRADMHGRLRRTARFIALTTYGSQEEAETAIGRVRGIHGHVRGTLPDGTPYSANDPEALAWVHATETVNFLGARLRYVEPVMPQHDRDRYFAEMAQVAEGLGAAPVPRSEREAWAFIEGMRPRLRADARTREVADLILRPKMERATPAPAAAMLFQAGIDLLPPWARAMHGLHSPALARPVVRAGTAGMARMLRWALA